MHCMECGMPFVDITDKALLVFDGSTPLASYDTTKVGLIDIHCPRHQCKQYYRMEMAA